MSKSDETLQAGSSNSNQDEFALLETLRAQHRQLDVQIKALQDSAISDPLKIARMKKRKLNIKDRISALEDSLTPDIIA